MRGAREAHAHLTRVAAQADTDSAAATTPDLVLVFSPIREADTAAAAQALGESLGGDRTTVLWDPDRTVGTVLADVVDVGDSPIAWDVYLWFDADVAWGDGPPVPTAWAHQLSGADPEHDHAGRLPAVFDAWLRRHATGESVDDVQPAPRDPTAATTFTIGADQIAPLPEVILQRVLEDWAATEHPDLSPEARRDVVDELRTRLRALRSEYADHVPRAVLLDGRIHTLPGDPSCLPETE